MIFAQIGTYKIKKMIEIWLIILSRVLLISWLLYENDNHQRIIAFHLEWTFLAENRHLNANNKIHSCNISYLPKILIIFHKKDRWINCFSFTYYMSRQTLMYCFRSFIFILQWLGLIRYCNWQTVLAIYLQTDILSSWNIIDANKRCSH